MMVMMKSSSVIAYDRPSFQTGLTTCLPAKKERLAYQRHVAVPTPCQRQVNANEYLTDDAMPLGVPVRPRAEYEVPGTTIAA